MAEEDTKGINKFYLAEEETLEIQTDSEVEMEVDTEETTSEGEVVATVAKDKMEVDLIETEEAIQDLLMQIKFL